MKYFTIAELSHSATAAQHHIDNSPPSAAVSALKTLTELVLDPLREAWGRPIYVNSGYRCPELNRMVGGATHSQHLLGQAADVTAGSTQANTRLWQLLQRLHLPVDQAIGEKHFTWLHISCGPRNRRSYFTIDC